MSARWLLFWLALLLADSCQAWGGRGHRLIADLAERQLDPSTQLALQPLLRQAGASRLAELADWADQVREQADYRWTVPLHFVNFRRGYCHYEPQRYCRQGACVVAAVNRYAERLVEPGRNADERSEALKFLVHFVADLHQPLHAGWREDLGGNTHQLRFQGRGSNLHQIWDRELLASSGESYRDQLQRLAASPAVRDPLPASSVAWAEESCRLLLQPGFYPSGRQLGAEYLERFRPLAEQRLLTAAARLAGLLERRLQADSEPPRQR